MPLLKRKKGESRQQQAVRTEISDYERHPKKFPGGKKQAIAIGLSMARKGINYMNFYDIIKAKSSGYDLNAHNEYNEKNKGERKKRREAHDIAAEAAGRKLPSRPGGLPFTKRGKKGEPFERAAGKDARPITMEARLKLLEEGRGNKGIIDRLKGAKTKPVSPVFSKSLYKAINLLRKSGRANKLFAKSFYDLVKGKNSKMMKQRLKERAKDQKERGIVNTAHAAGRRAPGFGSKQEALSPREFSPHYEEKAKLNNRSKNINAKSFYDLVKGSRKSGEGEPPRPHTNAVLDRKIKQLEARAAHILSGRRHPRGRYGYTATQALERDKKRVADANKKFADRGITFEVRGLAEKEKRAAEERREKAFDRMMSKPDETEHRQRNYEKMKGKPFPGKLHD